MCDKDILVVPAVTVECEVVQPNKIAAPSELLNKLFPKPEISKEQQRATALSWMCPWETKGQELLSSLLNKEHDK